MAGFCTFWEKDLYTSNPDLWKQLQPPFPLLPYLTQLGTVGVLSAGRCTLTTLGPICLESLLCQCHLLDKFFFHRRKKNFADEKLNFAGEKYIFTT